MGMSSAHNEDILSLMARARSQWYITFRATPHLDNKHTVFGKLVGGEEVLDTLEAVPVKPGTERPAKTIRITEVIMWVIPRCIILFNN
jgi:cyclophilin family peptidyl-prolyl cis-trans isomerase